MQLLEAGLEFLLFAVILLLFFFFLLSGRLIYLYLLTYSVIRFFDEFLRGDKIRGFVGPLSTSQFISVILFVAVISVAAVRKSRKGNAASQPSAYV